MKSRMKHLAAAMGLAVGLVAASQPALAWGDREQGILAGIVGTVLWSKLNERSHASAGGHPVGPGRIIHHHPHRVMAYQEPVTVIAPTRHCREVPVKDGAGQIIEIRRLCEQ